MLRRIMVPLDGSAFAEQALPLALTLARRARARLHLVRVRAPLPLEPETTEADEYLKRIAGQLESELPDRISHDVLTNEFDALQYPPPATNSVADVVARHAEAHDADLIVLTTHGRGGLKRAWIGSVADSLLRVAPRPVLLIRPEDEAFSVAARADRGMSHIVIPLDGSESAEWAIAYAQQLGELFTARYTLLRVVSPLTWDVSAEQFGAHPGVPVPVFSRAAAEQYLEQMAERMRAQKITVATHVLDASAAATAILDWATEHGPDLIALTTSGTGGIRRLLLGSVADKIVRSADVAVLVCNVLHLETAAAPALETAARTTER